MKKLIIKKGKKTLRRSQILQCGNYLPRKTLMKLHNLKPNLPISQMHLKTPTLGAVENKTLDLSSRCARITPMVIHT